MGRCLNPSTLETEMGFISGFKASLVSIQVPGQTRLYSETLSQIKIKTKKGRVVFNKDLSLILVVLDSETHSQTLNGDQGTPWRRERKIVGMRTPQQYSPQDQLSWAHRGSQRLKQQSQSLPAWF